MIYQTPPKDELLTQGDILDDCPIYRRAEDGVPIELVARIIVLTQACDLAQGKATRAVVAVVHSADVLVASHAVKAATVRDQIRLGKVFGMYFLPASPAPLEFPESIVDLRDLHTLPIGVLNQLVADGKRVARLATPFREHLAQHFAVTYVRIALPEPYATNP